MFTAPFDVRLFDEGKSKECEVFTVVQPDNAIICDADKLDDKGCIGAPDQIVEILSPSTAAKDLKVKCDLYEKHGVQEYWLVHPTDKIVMVYLAGADGEYTKAHIYDQEDTLHSMVFEGLEIHLTEIFQDSKTILSKTKKQDVS